VSFPLIFRNSNIILLYNVRILYLYCNILYAKASFKHKTLWLNIVLCVYSAVRVRHVYVALSSTQNSRYQKTFMSAIRIKERFIYIYIGSKCTDCRINYPITRIIYFQRKSS
jgi:hypothetical protein